MRVENRTESICHIIMLVILAFILIFTPLSFGVVTPAPLYISHLAVLSLIVVWVFKIVLTKRFKLLKTQTLIPIGLFLGYAFLRMTFSDIPFDARNEWIKIVDYALIYLVIINNFHRKKYIYNIIFIIILMAVFLSSLGIIQYIKRTETVYGINLEQELVTPDGGSPRDQEVRSFLTFIPKEKPKQYEHRASGTFICPNHLAGYLEIVFPIALAIFLFSRYVMGLRMFIGYTFALMIGAWLMTFSRGGWIAGITALIFFSLFSFMREDTRGSSAWFLPITIIVVVLLMIGVFVKPIQDRIMTIKPTGDPSAETRIKIWVDSLQMIKLKPVFGYGPAAFLWHYPRFKHEGLTRKVTFTHNDYLNTIADYGVVGLIIALSFLIMMIRKIKKVDALYDYPDSQALLIGGVSALIAVAVHALFDFNNHIYSNAVLFFLVSGIITVVACNLENNHECFWRFPRINRNPLLLNLGGWAVFVIVLMAGVHCSRLFLSEMYYKEGNKLQENVLWDKAMNSYVLAQKFDPLDSRPYAKIAEVIHAQNVFRKRQDESALNYYDLALKYNPYESDYMFKKALILKSLGRKEEAYKLMQEAQKQEPTNTAYTKEIEKLEKQIQASQSQ